MLPSIPAGGNRQVDINIFFAVRTFLSTTTRLNGDLIYFLRVAVACLCLELGRPGLGRRRRSCSEFGISSARAPSNATARVGWENTDQSPNGMLDQVIKFDQGAKRELKWTGVSARIAPINLDGSPIGGLVPANPVADRAKFSTRFCRGARMVIRRRDSVASRVIEGTPDWLRLVGLNDPIIDIDIEAASTILGFRYGDIFGIYPAVPTR